MSAFNDAELFAQLDELTAQFQQFSNEFDGISNTENEKDEEFQKVSCPKIFVEQNDKISCPIISTRNPNSIILTVFMVCFGTALMIRVVIYTFEKNYHNK